jgi:hypothetical protein
MPPATKKCKEVSVTLGLLMPDNKRQISFVMNRGCIDDSTPVYDIIFVLRDLIDDQFQDRVKLRVTIGPQDNEKAQLLMDRGLKASQIDFLNGPITNRTKKLPPGTASDPASEKKLLEVFDK